MYEVNSSEKDDIGSGMFSPVVWIENSLRIFVVWGASIFACLVGAGENNWMSDTKRLRSKDRPSLRIAKVSIVYYLFCV